MFSPKGSDPKKGKADLYAIQESDQGSESSPKRGADKNRSDKLTNNYDSTRSFGPLIDLRSMGSLQRNSVPDTKMTMSNFCVEKEEVKAKEQKEFRRALSKKSDGNNAKYKSAPLSELLANLPDNLSDLPGMDEVDNRSISEKASSDSPRPKSGPPQISPEEKK